MDNNMNNIEEYIQDVQNEFVGKYSKQLDDHVFAMLKEFGFEGTEDDIPNWLYKNNYNIMVEEIENDDENVKMIYLLDLKHNVARALFFIRMREIGNNLAYKFSDIIVNNEG